ncbi:hypothetical protein Htur_4862 (plasmid) [Haloterrigena turkmenica DSM 5511]|uniref:Uncharacterized protein n=1 Tax=Haloterrigena turkmenica (strain ATCC 51198 / DSM 5511 / JCM 9101 / NCIMB 13204 / VKM B-1734 / 4k) TaxID=543526 RepID=D2S2M3_HALTV|nr:hypothetical protein Htur_4862 [Haloterrigena turkmenica DSM 5511]
MRCEWRQRNCTKVATQRLSILFQDSGRQHTYYCEAHALIRLSELENGESATILSADEFETTP